MVVTVVTSPLVKATTAKNSNNAHHMTARTL
jgi:hypothetical protein